MMFMGDKVFSTFGIPEPELYVTMKKNKMQTLFAFFLINNVATSQLATNAFEVSYDGNLLFSKLEQQRIPQVEEIIRALNNVNLQLKSA